MATFVFTCGDTNGIGPEISIKAFEKVFKRKNLSNIIFICPENIFHSTYKSLKAKFNYQFIDSELSINPSVLNVFPLKNVKSKIGYPTKDSGAASFQAIESAIHLVKVKKADAIITAPISKYAFSLAGIDFPGHTELFASVFNTKKYLMMFLSTKMIAALVTTHLPIDKVSKSLNKKKIAQSIEVLIESLKIDLAIKNPTVAILGLNPHAGEKGKIGSEEIKLINPAIRQFLKLNVKGPFVPDAFFANKTYKNFDAVLGMYHDQLLIPFKMMNFNSGVNFTAGLPIVRTSPDHGTAFDIAGNGNADPSSMLQAFNFARTILKNRKRFERHL